VRWLPCPSTWDGCASRVWTRAVALTQQCRRPRITFNRSARSTANMGSRDVKCF